MPERNFQIEWPDGLQESCYSPSSTIENHLKIGQTYSLKDFLSTTELALNEASERVRARYGFACSSAMDQLKKIKERSKAYESMSDAKVIVLSIS